MPPDPHPAGPSSGTAGLVWFFGYGSLMWNTGFVPDAFEPARLDGWHRRFCIVSRHYRGTPERPGLVLGLAPGGHCVGRAIGVAPAREPEVLAYLDDREQVGGVYVYERRRLPVTLLSPVGDARPGMSPPVQAWCYLADIEHADYAGALTADEVRGRISLAIGSAGSNRAYVLSTVAHLADLGVADPELTALAHNLAD